MSSELLALDELPAIGEIICCKWPGTIFINEEDIYVRGVLVLDAWRQRDRKSGHEYGVVKVCYGTDVRSTTDFPNKLVISLRDERECCGLSKATKFLVVPKYVKDILWSEEYFFPRKYDGRLFLGYLPEGRMKELQSLVGNLP